MTLYPLLLEPIYKEKVWGGRSLERFGRALPPGVKIGESWELADLAATSPTGGGGEGARSKIRNGPLAGRTLGEVVRDFGALVTGRMPLGDDGSFPLLLKYLDARDNLSVQVHPSADYAAAHPGAHLKSEAWYVVDADPGAVLYEGIVEGTTPEAFREAIADGSVADLLIAVPARPGECHYLPSGTCHALGAGILVAEVQTASDTTFRVFDWDRTDRELHVEEAMQCIDFGPMRSDRYQPGTREAKGDAVSRLLVECEHFSIHEWKLPAESELAFDSHEPSILMMIEGGGELRWDGEEAPTLGVRAGDTVLLPAALTDARLSAEDAVTLLEVSGPSRE